MDSSASSDLHALLPCTNEETARLQRIHQEIGQAFLEDIQCLVKQPLRLDSTALKIIHNRGALESDSIEFSRNHPQFMATAHGTGINSTGIEQHVAWICPAVTATYFLDALLGGGRYLPPPLARPFTDIELGLLNRLASLLWKHVETQWSTLTAMQLQPRAIDGEDFLMQFDALGDPLLLVRWNLSSQHARATMQLAYAWTDVQRMIQRRTVGTIGDSATLLTEVPPPALYTTTDHPLSTVQLDWAYTSLPRRDAQTLEVGDLLITDAAPDALVRILVNGRCDRLGKLGNHSGQLSLKIENRAGDEAG
ncbi:MAG: FliM/FliN family flagellar motor switch protein [Planctomycetota bacterium]|nr:FliM/FliN family flagellar motor switch protein [Planctomycetota bacterium]MDA1178961.1 FliM/FliN family flagellar motor switch protein [Planctomycetota bacterium]